MTIERFKNADVPYDLLYLADEDDERIADYRDSALFWAAREGNEVRGMAGFSEGDGMTGEIVCLAVSEKRQNGGIGTRLIEEVLAYGKEEGFRDILIKTGNNGIWQIYLYQRCGFRLDSINKDYFPRNYHAPLYENSLQCVDQVVLRYRIFNQAERDGIVERFWKKFLESHGEYEGRSYEAWHFCYGESLPNKLLGLVREGRKRGTSSARELYEAGEKIPEVGDLSLITGGNGIPRCIIETKEIRIRKFREIGAEEARLEGEGDLSLAYWRRSHESFFRREYEEAGKTFTEDIPVLFERFEVIYDEDKKTNI